MKDLIFNNNFKNNTKRKEKEEEIKYYDTILESIDSIFISENYDTSKLDRGEDEVIETEKTTVTFTTFQNQKNNTNNNITIIELGECEKSLRNHYNISNNQTLYMKKIEVNQEGMKILKIEIDVYCKFSGKNLTKLNLSVCSDIKIYLSVPSSIPENIDILNSSSGYYNDLCYIATSESGTDISLKDRKNEYINKTICQDDYDFLGYDYETQKANFSCKVKQSSLSFADINIDKSKLYKNFVDFENIANVKILVCYQQLFEKVGLLHNIGFYLISLIIILHIIFIFIFYLKHFSIIKVKIDDIFFGIKNIGLIQHKTNDQTKMNKKQEFIDNKNYINRRKTLNNNITKNTRSKAMHLNIKNNTINLGNKGNKKREINPKNKKDSLFKRKNLKKLNTNLNKSKNNAYKYPKKTKQNSMNKKQMITGGNNKKNNLTQNLKLNNQKIIEKIRNILKYTDDEINNLEYELALQYDKRTYCQYYFSLLKTNQDIIYTFCGSKDYNSKVIKIDLFFVNLSMFYIINALFFDDETMHNIYETKGAFNLEYQLPKTIYSTLISSILYMILKFLALSNDKIVKFKKNRSQKDLISRKNNLKRNIIISIVLYFIISFILLAFFWYYISMFGAIYKNTQYHLLKDTLISFGLSTLNPFVYYLFPGLFRVPSLSNPKNKRKCLYIISKLLQLPNFLCDISHNFLYIGTLIFF